MSEPLQFPDFPKPQVRVTLWEGRGKPVEQEIRDRLTSEGYGVVKWNSEGATGYGPHAHIYPETMWVIEGSVTVALPTDGRLIELLPGDRIEIPQGVLHAVVAGAEGAAYLLATR
ncbi:MAG: cupin domain-containing protein [Anaerolineae bacterium]|jgi:quercetin dioxygenase-like cupin family protein|nr:cupin domain-containing protein [Anaerolineae bacterium]